MVFWFLFWLAAGIMILVLSHFFGVKVFNTADKIYKSFNSPNEDLDEVREQNPIMQLRQPLLNVPRKHRK